MAIIKFRVQRDEDIIEATILEDGTVRLDVQGEISFTNHSSADEAVRQVERLLGGKTEVQKHGHAHHHHAHGHGQQHTH